MLGRWFPRTDGAIDALIAAAGVAWGGDGTRRRFTGFDPVLQRAAQKRRLKVLQAALAAHGQAVAPDNIRWLRREAAGQ